MDQLLEDIQGNVHVLPGSIASFLSIMVPSYAPDVPKRVSQRAFSKYGPPKGKKVKNYPGLLSGLRAAVSSFPDNKRPKFFPLRRKELPFPFPECSRGHYPTTPDLAISFPGVTCAAFDWQNTAMFIQVKGNRADDPFEEVGDLSGEHGATVVQLAIGARALMAVHGHCAVFALGIYATTCRIIRFDPACVVASPPFSLKRRPDHLQRFFWRLSHPHEVALGESIVGCDRTIRRLTLAEQDWLVDSLQAAGHAVPSNLATCRHVECEGTCGDTVVLKAYFTVGFIDVSPRLLSQATVVWRAVEDPRRPPDAHLSVFPKVEGDIVMVVVKDSWRQMHHRSDPEFFDRIEERIPKHERIGLPAYVVGRDLGDAALLHWAAASRFALPRTIDAIRKQLEDESDYESESASPVPMPVTMPAGSPPLPLQQTCTSHLVRGSEGIKNERSHMRFVTSTVGRPLTEFKDTRQLCQALRDAIAAHKILWEKPRILHRDISPRNILIRADADLCQPAPGFVGFLHDFHHGSMAAGGVGRLASLEPDGDVDNDTRYFMATELLESPDARHEVDHDLESFFWVLLWVVLRHTKHLYPPGGDECTMLFGTGPENVDVDRHGAHKRSYLFSLFYVSISVWDNEPLSGLLSQFKSLCTRSMMGGPFGSSPRRMTHDQVLAIFDSALREDGWPTDGDGPRPFVAPSDS